MEFGKDLWHYEVKTIAQRNNIRLRRWGMAVTVYSDGTPANNTTWVLVYGLSTTNRADDANWQTLTAYVGGGGGGSATTPKTAYFNGDGATLTFNIADAATILIHSVFVGGQRYAETVDYTKNDAAKTITFLGAAVPAGVGIDVEYFAGVSVATDFLQSAIASTAGATINLDFTGLKQLIFVGSASFAANKIIALLNSGSALKIEFVFTITALVVLTLPANFKMSDALWDNAAKTWTAADTGEFKARGTYDGANWLLTIEGPFS